VKDILLISINFGVRFIRSKYQHLKNSQDKITNHLNNTINFVQNTINKYDYKNTIYYVEIVDRYIVNNGPTGRSEFIEFESKTYLTKANSEKTVDLGIISVPLDLKFGTTLFGQEAHIQASALLQLRLEAVGVIDIINRTERGLTGVDMTVPRAFEQRLGFRHIEIKPNTASGLKSLIKQVRSWGLDCTTVMPVTYDAQGYLRWGFDF
jgi:hypothetical protein